MGAELRARAMGTDVHVVVHGPADLVALAGTELHRLEAAWSRFRPDSEVSELNRRAGEWVPVSADTIALVERARHGWLVTGGRYDPTVLGDVVRAGYDRTFEAIASVPAPVGDLGADVGTPHREDHAGEDGPRTRLRDGSAPGASTAAADPAAVGGDRDRGASGIEVDQERSAVRLPAGVGFDPGGIGKGLAADLIAERIDREGAAGVLVNLGGDLRAIGHGPDGDDWTVAVDPASTGTALATVRVHEGAVATSTTLRRRWRVGGEERHHLIDPATGRPAAGDLVAATVLAARGWQAEVLAKAALVAGVDEGLDLVRNLGADAVLVDRFGGLHPTAGFARFTTAALATSGPAPVPCAPSRDVRP